MANGSSRDDKIAARLTPVSGTPLAKRNGGRIVPNNAKTQPQRQKTLQWKSPLSWGSAMAIAATAPPTTM
ncbi:hypothetical protein G6F39_014444 [Rhizopus arrhizus]|nr:hypothetical protein G6F39_014444 [Rhizopus arrhizus]